MGQILGSERAKKVREEQVQNIIDYVFDHYTHGKGYLTGDELYTAILLVYNDINKRLPGPHQEPPSKEEVQEILKTYDTNEDGHLDRREFSIFVHQYTAHLVTKISRNILLFSIGAPCLAMLTKTASERLPGGVGDTVQKIPNALYASIITTLIAVVTNVNGNV